MNVFYHNKLILSLLTACNTMDVSLARVISHKTGFDHPVTLIESSGVKFVFPSMDNVIGRHLMEHGTYDPVELSFLMQFVEAGMSVVEVGSNVGPYSVHIARKVGPSGRLTCFEPFRLIYQILNANIALNGLNNTELINAAGGDWPERHMDADGPNLNREDNYGASTLLDMSRRTWILSDTISERIRIVPLDSLEWSRKVDLLKIDAEGMEYDVVRGAKKQIHKDRPVLYVENGTHDIVSGLPFENWMEREFGYACYRPEGLKQHYIVMCMPRTS